MTQENQETSIPSNDQAILDKVNETMRENLKHTIKSVISMNKSSLMKLIMESLENQKSEYAFYGAEATLNFLVCGMQISCNNTLFELDGKRIVLQSFLRMEDVPVSQPTSNSPTPEKTT